MPTFTKQPQDATIAWNGFCKVTWDTNYPPVSAQVQYHNISNNGWETYSDPYYLVGGQIAEDKLSANFHYNDYLKGKEFRIYVRCSEQEDDDYGRIYSQPFMISYIQSIITFDAGGGNGNMPKTYITEELPYSYTLPDCDFTWVGHVFDKWQVGTEYYQPGDEIQIMSDTTIRATWKKYCTVTFNANGGTGSMESVSLLEGSEYILPENAFTSDTHNFSYWAVSAYPNSWFHAGSKITVSGNITVTAVWVPKVWCTLTFDMNGYGTQVQPITVEQGTIVSEPTKPTSTYRFAYWEVNEGSVIDHWVPFDFDQPVTKSATLRAHWISNAMRRVKLSYDHEAGTVELSATGMDGECVPVGEQVHISITTNPHWSVNYIKVGTLTLNTGARVFEMPNQETVYVSVAFTLDHDHTAGTMTVYPAVEPTCEEDGRAAYYYCSTCGHYYYNRRVGITDYKTWMENGLEDLDLLTIPALGHDYGAPTYEWAEDYGSVTATCICSRDSSHVMTETVATTVTVTKEPGSFTRGEHTYTAAFENPAFATQTFVLDDIEPLGIPLTEEYFPDANFRAYVSGKYDKDSNGYLSDAERSGREYFQCNNQGVASLRGLEYFPNIVRLYANGNPDLTALNLSGFPLLQLVQVHNSPLASLRVAGCPNLTTLMLKGCALTHLNLSDNPNLRQLNVIDCAGLRTLDISNNPDLRYLNTYGSGIGYLDIQANAYILAALNGTLTVEADYDRYSDGDSYMNVNHGTEFSGQGCIPVDAAHFPDPVFRMYVEDNADSNESGWLSVNEMEAMEEIYLNVTAFADLTSVEGIDYFPEVTELIIENTPLLAGIDLSGNTKITSLEISNTGLTTLNVSGLQLEYLDCIRNQMTSLNLGNQPALTHLYCYGNPGIKTLDIRNAPLLLDAVINGTMSVPDWGDLYEGPMGGVLYVDAGTELITSKCIPVDSAHFPDEIFRDYVRDHFDLNTSGWLSPAEISGATEIVLDANAGLTSLQGIEYLTELTYLEVDDSPLLESVDISGNNKLSNVNFYNTGLIALDVDGLRLTYLSCDDSPLEALTLGVQPNLKSLTCYRTELAEVDITGCPYMIEAYHGEKIFDASTTSDNYINGSYMLAVNKGATVITGIPEPTFFLPAALTAIEAEAFSGISARAVVIPNTVTGINGNPFAGSGVTTIYGYAGSAAQTLATTYGYTFVAITDDWMAWH